MTTNATSSIFLIALLFSLAACEADDVSPLVDEKIGANLASKATWNLSDGSEYPSGRILSRAEDGVMFGDGSLVVADQRYGLVKVPAGGTVEQFGDFKSVGYRHDPPEIEAAPNGVHLTPDGLNILTADVFTGHIYRTSVATGNTEIAYSHSYGVNTAIEDSTGAIWFTQSTKNRDGNRLYEALQEPMPDGALYRLPPASDESNGEAELIVDNLNFANGFYLDETANKLYLAETMAHRILAFDLNVSSGSISNQKVLGPVPTPDNMRMYHDGSLWVASPLSNQILSFDPNSGERAVVFDAQTSKGAQLVEAGVARGVADQIGPDLIGGMPGLLTGIIVGAPGQPFYVSNLGDALVRVEKK